MLLASSTSFKTSHGKSALGSGLQVSAWRQAVRCLVGWGVCPGLAVCTHARGQEKPRGGTCPLPSPGRGPGSVPKPLRSIARRRLLHPCGWKAAGYTCVRCVLGLVTYPPPSGSVMLNVASTHLRQPQGPRVTFWTWPLALLEPCRTVANLVPPLLSGPQALAQGSV